MKRGRGCTIICGELIVPSLAGLHEGVGDNHWSVSHITAIPGEGGRWASTVAS